MVRQLSDGDDAGQSLGQSTTDLISFYGETPIAQRTSSLATINTSGLVSGIGYGFSYASMTTLLAGYNEMVRTLQLLGLHG